ncbi:uncharacterized protein LOC121240120 [Juglans microcarpa x Juglans regia]|uniref:uncharacterized protein LOC121240120 n=1 Tax=Juglans microcarpa x Juglans regia TaxID=2249226 RepID=UPI001B7E0995|nr:uncharacterized protein LOC121240120 [Juglans microcarpa x Juglans regia]
MDISLIAETVNVATAQGLVFAKSILRRHCLASHNNNLSISAVLFAVGALAPPTVRSHYSRTGARTFLRKKCRTRRRSFSGEDSEDGEDDGFFGDGGDGPFGGGGGGGGRGWNFDGFGGLNWDGSPSPPSDPAFDFVYEVICWIALSNCVHFAFKRIVQILADGIGDAEREKVPMRLTSVC